MSERESNERIDADLRALRSATACDLPTLDATASAVRRTLPSSNRERSFTPALATLAGAMALAIVSIFVPVSWERTVGHDVTLELEGQPSENRIQEVVADLRQSLAADGVKVTVRDGVCRLEAATSDVSRSRLGHSSVLRVRTPCVQAARTACRSDARTPERGAEGWIWELDLLRGRWLRRDWLQRPPSRSCKSTGCPTTLEHPSAAHRD